MWGHGPSVPDIADEKHAYRKLKKRVRALEAQMREIYQRLAPASESEGEVDGAAGDDL